MMTPRHGWTLAVALSLSGCFYPSDRGKLLEERVEKLSDQNANLTAQLKDQQDKLTQTLPKVDQKIAEVSRALQSLDTASHRTGADIAVQLQKTVEDLAQLRGQVDSYLHNINELNEKLASMQSTTDQRLTDLQGVQAKREAEGKREAEKLSRPSDKREFYALAQGKMKAGEGPVARQLFHEFIKKWPRDALVGEAYFNLGELAFSEKACDQALPDYGKVVENYPKSVSAPMALLRSSECFKGLGKPNEARYALEELVKDYPKSEAAKLARRKLASGGGSKKTTKASSP